MQKNMSYIQRLLFILALLALTITTVAQTSNTLTSDQPVSGTLDATNIADVYTFDAPADSSAIITADSADIAIGILVVDSTGNTIAEQSTGETNTIAIDMTFAQADTYTLTVFSTSAGEGSYNLAFALTTPETVETTATEVPTDSSIVTELPASEEILLNNGIEVRLQWDEAVDLNLEVRDPVGNTLFFNSRTSPIGGSFGFDANGLCEVISGAPVETASWQPGFLPTGSYEILVFYRQTCEDAQTTTVPFTLTVTVNGQVLETIEATISESPNPNNDSVYLANFTIEDQDTATLQTGGLYPDTAINNLPASITELRADANPITLGTPVQGAIFEEQDYVVYSFNAEPNQIVTASMTATSRNLDTLLQLVGPNGALVAVNDDAQGTNSIISNQALIEGGEYLLIATRYGKEVGGTEGQFSLSLTESTSVLPASVASLNVPDGSVQIFLTWNTNADLQLLVRDPVGNAIFDDEPTAPSGGILAENGNVGCTVSEGDPLSYIYWPSGILRPGTYEIDVWYQSTCDDNSIVDFTLTVIVNGQVVLVEQANPTFLSDFVTNFTVNPDGTAVAGQAGFVGSGVTLADIEDDTRIPIQANVPVTGTITADNAYDVYTFSGTAGQVITVLQQAVPGSILDTQTFLLSSAGITLFSNDDAPVGSIIGTTERTTDSIITGYILPADGEYLIVASRYATIYGGTTGAYQLTLQTGQ